MRRVVPAMALVAMLVVPFGLAGPPAASAQGTITVETKERGSEEPALYACYNVQDRSNGSGNGAVGAACDGDDGFIDGTTIVTVSNCDPCRVSQSLPDKPDDQPTDYLLQPFQDGSEGDTFTFRNFLKPYFVVTARDSRTGNPVKGACVAVGSSAGGCDGDAADLDGQSNGQITTKRVPDGEYNVVLTRVPADYVDGNPSQVIVADPAETGEFESVTFDVVSKPRISVKTVDAKSGKRLKGACYAIAENVPGGALGSFCDGVKNGTFGDQDGVKNGVVVTRPLEAGRTYVIDQTTAPRGYRLVGPNKTVTTAAGTTSAVTFKNRPKG